MNMNKYDLNNRYDEYCECRSASSDTSDFYQRFRWNSCNERTRPLGYKEQVTHMRPVQWTSMNDLNVQFTVQFAAFTTRIRGFFNCESREMQLFLTAKIEVFGLLFHVFFSIFFVKKNVAPCSNHLAGDSDGTMASSRIPWLVPTGRWPPAELRSCHSQMVQQPANAHRDLQNDETCSRNM